MKIICTKQEKDNFIRATINNRYCPFLFEEKTFECISKCGICCEENIEWEIIND